MSSTAGRKIIEPNFFIVGAPKCGTTALFDYLAQHPNVWCPLNKEPSFFCSDFPQLQGPKIYDDYLQLFASAGDQHIAIGEASVVYFYSNVAVTEIRRRYPDARLIVMIRNPVDMVTSFHSQLCITLNEDEPDFYRAWQLQDARAKGLHIPKHCVAPDFLQYRKVARLSRFIEPILNVFPPDQVRTIVLDDMQADPLRVFNEITDYLDLPRFSEINFRVVNANRTHASKLLATLTERPGNLPWLRVLRKIKKAVGLNHLGFRRALARFNTRTLPRAALAPEFRKELVEYFASEVTALEQLTGRDFSHWRK